jgi:L-lactate utilization protein LutB
VARVTQYSAANLIGEAGVDPERWNAIPSDEEIYKTGKEVEQRGISVFIVQSAEEALGKVRALIPPGAEVMNGSSTTLIEIGFESLLNSGKHQWKDYHKVITSEDDAQKRAYLRRKSITSEYFLSSANAVAQTGEIVACDATGSRNGAWSFGAGRLILVVGANKIVPSLDEALERIRRYAYPLENVRAKKVYGTPSRIGKCVILAEESEKGRVILILVKDRLGY